MALGAAPRVKVALLDPFPARTASSDRLLIDRCLDVLARLGHRGSMVCCSDELLAEDPDFVIIPNHLVPKLTHHFTVGLLLSPTQLYSDNLEIRSAIRSWDLAVPVNVSTRRFARDLHFPVRHERAVSQMNFYPSAATAAVSFPAPVSFGLAYVGIGDCSVARQRLLVALAGLLRLHVYGPADIWGFVNEAYRGPAPDRLVEVLNRHGAALVLHDPAYVDEGVPSAAIFEALAAKCLVITDAMPALRPLFGDSLCMVDISGSPDAAARAIAATVQNLQARPEAFVRKVKNAQEVFLAQASLERLLEDLILEVRDRLRIRDEAAAEGAEAPAITVILRCGGRPLAMLERAVASLRRQTHRRIGLVLVRFAAVEGFEAWLDEERRRGRFLFVREVVCAATGIRSQTMWAGLRSVETEQFCMLDDDDENFPDHLAELAALLRTHREIALVYTGAVRQEEDGVLLNLEPRFAGDRDVRVAERRALQKFDDFDLERLLVADCFIQSNAWLARREVLTPEVLDDPELEVAEDLYFYLLLASRHKFLFSGTATALWNWRTMARDNSATMVMQPVWEDCVERVRRRLSNVSFPMRRIGMKAPRIIGGRGGRPEPEEADAPAPAAELDVAGGFEIVFSAPRMPKFVMRWKGLSGAEPWGRWSEGPELVLKFWKPLPSRFVLAVQGYAFESNHEQPIVVQVGERTAEIVMPGAFSECFYDTTIDNPDGADSMVFRIPNPQAPSDRWPGQIYDNRLLGMALMRLQVTAVQAAPPRLVDDRG